MATSSNSTTVPKNSSKKLLPKQSNNHDLIDAIDELYVAKNMFECVFHAVGGAGIETETVRALQAVLCRAQETLDAGIAKVQGVQDEVQS